MMNKSRWGYLFCLVVLTVSIGLVVFFHEKEKKSLKSDDSKINWKGNIDPRVYIDRGFECKLENGMEGICVKVEMCNDSSLRRVITLENNDKKCDVDDANVICCAEEKPESIQAKLKLLNHEKCGQQTSVDRIYKGNKAQSREFRFYAALKYLINGLYVFGCGGSLISGEIDC
jgi:hypothetical protein